MPRGRFDSYVRRHLLDIQEPGIGVGRPARYRPLEALKLMAIDGLAQAGAWDQCLYDVFRQHGAFEAILHDYYHAPLSQRRGRTDPIEMNTQQDRFFIENPEKPHPYESDLELNVSHARGEWPPREWHTLVFEVATFIEVAVPKVIAFLETKGVQVEDR